MIVFFDIGATLVEGPDVAPATHLAASLGLSSEQQRQAANFILTHRTMSYKAAAQELAGALGMREETVSDELRRLWENQTRAPRPIPGAIDAVFRLVDAGFRVGLISNIWHPYFVGACNALRPLFEEPALFSPQMLSYDIGFRKPGREIFQMALMTAGESAKRCIMVGDSYENDIAPAIAVGMRTVWIMHRPHAESASVDAVRAGIFTAPDLICRSIRELEPASLQLALRCISKPSATTW